MITIRAFKKQDRAEAMEIWNEVVREGVAFPQVEELTEQEAGDFFSGQSYTGVAVDGETGEVVGLYILHPNNVGRCGHICNTSYAVRSDKRGLHIGEQLVKDSLAMGARLVSASCNSTRLWLPMSMLCISMSAWASHNWAESPKASS